MFCIKTLSYVLAYCGGASGFCAGGFSNPITATILGGIFVDAVVAGLFTGGFFAHPVFDGLLKPRQPLHECAESAAWSECIPKPKLGSEQHERNAGTNKVGYVAQVFKTDGAFDYKAIYCGAGWGTDKNQFVGYGNWNYGYTCGALYAQEHSVTAQVA
jgi:hypothetical protein